MEQKQQQQPLATTGACMKATEGIVTYRKTAASGLFYLTASDWQLFQQFFFFHFSRFFSPTKVRLMLQMQVSCYAKLYFQKHISCFLKITPVKTPEIKNQLHFLFSFIIFSKAMLKHRLLRINPRSEDVTKGTDTAPGLVTTPPGGGCSAF